MRVMYCDLWLLYNDSYLNTVVTFTGRWTGLEHVRWRIRGQLRRRVQRIFTTGWPTIATHVRAVTALASSRPSQEVCYDDGQSGPSDEQPPAKPQSIGKFTEGGSNINVFEMRVTANGGGLMIIYNIFLFYQGLFTLLISIIPKTVFIRSEYTQLPIYIQAKCCCYDVR